MQSSFIHGVFWLLFAVPVRADVLEVGGPYADYSNIWAAANAAQDGDLILVSSGSYSGFSLQGKSVTVTSLDENTVVDVDGPVVISGLLSNQDVVLRGLNLTLSTGWESALTVEQCDGTVRIERCRLTNTSSIYSALHCSQSQLVQISDSFIANTGGYSEHGIESQSSNLLLDRTIVRGTQGEDSMGLGYEGGHGLLATGSGAHYVYLQGSALAGGRGGDGLQSLACGWGGKGGNGFSGSGVRLYVFDSQLLAGAGGAGSCGQSLGPGLPASYVTGTLSGTRSSLRVPDWVPADGTARCTLTGQPGDQVSYAVRAGGGVTEHAASTPTLRSTPVRGKHDQEWRIAGVIGPSGTMELNIPMPGSAGPNSQVGLYVQARVQFASQVRHTHPGRIQVVDAAIGHVCRLFSPQRSSTCGNDHVNSTGQTGVLSVLGDACRSSNDQQLLATGLPQRESGLFLCSPHSGWIFDPFQTMGAFCLSPNYGVYPVGAPSDSLGTLTRSIDVHSMPTQPSQPFLAGTTWHFQLWYRDSANASTGATSQVTNAVSVTLW